MTKTIEPAPALTAVDWADTSEPEAHQVLSMAAEHGVRIVDFKFTDLPGTWQHIGMSARALSEDAFETGLGFDGSSIRGFQEISESDMVLVPDPTTAIIDPFHEEPTMSVICVRGAMRRRRRRPKNCGSEPTPTTESAAASAAAGGIPT